MFKKLSLKIKLLLSFSVVSLTLVAVGLANYVSLNKVVEDYKHISDVNLTNSIHLSDMYRYAMALKYSASVVGAANIPENEKQRVIKEYNSSLENFNEAIAEYKEVPFVEGEQELFEAFEKSFKAFETSTSTMMKLGSTGNPADLQKYSELVFTDLKKTNADFTQKYEALYNFQNKDQVQSWVAKADESSDFGVKLSFTLIFAGVAVAMFIGWSLSHSLSSILTKLAATLKSESESVADVASKISSASNSLSSSATEQAAALQETVASIDEVSAMVQKNADNSKRSQEKSMSCDQAVAKGKETVDQVIHAISEISSSNTDIMNQVESSNRQLTDIVNVINEIATKTKVINDIVFQTKLLSFNASVEAARAGEHGKGFAVVAQEVGNLAEMSGNAAKEISSMLEGSVKKVEVIVNETKSKVETLISIGKSKVDTGTETAQRCGEMLDEIVALVREVNLMVSEISTASQEQSQGVSEINKAMTQMDQVTQMNATAAQETASSASVLSGQATNLKMMVEELSSTIHGVGKQEKKAHSFVAPKKVEALPTQKKTNVVSLSKHKVEAVQKKVIAPQVKVQEKVVKPSVKMVSGGDIMPSSDDPRFEDI